MPDNSNNNSNNDEYEKYCYMCRRPESETGRLFGMAENLYICPDCLQKAFNTLNNNNFQFMDFSKFPGFDNMNAFTQMNDIPNSRHRKMKPFPATAPQEKSHVRKWRSKGHLAPLMRPTKFPEIPVSLERNTEVFRHPLL